MRGYHGWIGCGYLNPATASRLGDAAAIFTGVATHDDMLAAKAVAVSTAGEALGMAVGMTGAAALELIRGNQGYKIVPKAPCAAPRTPGFDWSGLTCEHIPLRWPLLVVRGSSGMVRTQGVPRTCTNHARPVFFGWQRLTASSGCDRSLRVATSTPQLGRTGRRTPQHA